MTTAAAITAHAATMSATVTAGAATMSTAVAANATTIAASVAAHSATLITYDQGKELALTIGANAMLVLHAIELVAYYNAADDAIDARDEKIDDQIEFMQTLQDLKADQDLPMVLCKKDVLVELGLPSIDMCSSVSKMTSLSNDDGDAVDTKAIQLSGESCGGKPDNWKTHEGRLMSGKTGGYVGGLVANSEKRRLEVFRNDKNKLVRTGHTGLKSIYSASETLTQYAQAASIHSGLADLFIQGFNSAGAGLGVALGKMGTGTGGDKGSTTQSTSNGPTNGGTIGPVK